MVLLPRLRQFDMHNETERSVTVHNRRLICFTVYTNKYRLAARTHRQSHSVNDTINATWRVPCNTIPARLATAGQRLDERRVRRSANECDPDSWLSDLRTVGRGLGGPWRGLPLTPESLAAT